jgi:spore coat polysaccharide biosynthesis protein SpsF (cytidylyltransferase family)
MLVAYFPKITYLFFALLCTSTKHKSKVVPVLIKHHALKMYRGMEAKLLESFTSAFDSGKWKEPPITIE